MNKAIVEQLSSMLQEGKKIRLESITPWRKQVFAFLSVAVGKDEAYAFDSIVGSTETDHGMRLGHIAGLIARENAGDDGKCIDSSREIISRVINSKKVFVVHGHDEAAKEASARHIEKLGLEAIILHEQPSSGKTIIEKFETYSGDIGFAVVLLTADDVGGRAEPTPTLLPRARQNVVLELGYFVGKLGRGRVCVLHKGGVELPSDFNGVIYIEMDAPGAWRTKLAQEFIEARLSINLEGLLGG